MIQEELIQAGDMLAVFFSVLIGAFSLGQAAPNVESVLTAAGAAGEVFDTIDRVSADCWWWHLLIHNYAHIRLNSTRLL